MEDRAITDGALSNLDGGTGPSTAEATCRAVVRHREAVFGLPEDRRQERIRLLKRLFDLFEGHDAEEEVRRLKEQDEGF